MKVAIITNSFSRNEGQGRVNLELARGLAESGHEVTCVASSVTPDLLGYPEISWVKMPDANWPIPLFGNHVFAWASTHWLRQHSHQFDRVIANGFNTWHPVHINIVHFTHSAWLRSPVHDIQVRRGPKAWYQGLYTLVNGYLERKVLKRADKLVAVSEKVRRELTQIGVPDSRIDVIHNGVDLDEFSPAPVSRKALSLPDSVPLALFAGDIRTRRKNLDSVLQALVDVPELHLAVAGGTEGSPFPALSRQLGLDNRVHFLGFRDDVPDLMRASDFFAFPSRYEACSLVLLEAMASGLPIVTAETTGGAELVSDKMGVVLSDPDDTSGLTDALRMLSRDSARRDVMKKVARGKAERHGWGHMAQEYRKILRNESPVAETAV